MASLPKTAKLTDGSPLFQLQETSRSQPKTPSSKTFQVSYFSGRRAIAICLPAAGAFGCDRSNEKSNDEESPREQIRPLTSDHYAIGAALLNIPGARSD